MLWSVAPDRSWDSSTSRWRRPASSGSASPRARSAPGSADRCGGLAALLGAALAWSLAGKASLRSSDGARAARHAAVGYWNALAARRLRAAARPLARRPPRPPPIGAGLRRRPGLRRRLPSLTASRTGVVAGAVALALGFPRAGARRARSPLAGIAPARPSATGPSRPALVDDLQPHGARAADGAWFGLLALAGAAAARSPTRCCADPSTPRAVPRRWTRAARRVRRRRRPRRAHRFGRQPGHVGGRPVPAARRSPRAPGGSRASSRTTAGSGGGGLARLPRRPARARSEAPSVARKRYRENGRKVTQPHNSPSSFCRHGSRRSRARPRLRVCGRDRRARCAPARRWRAGRRGRSPSRPPPTVHALADHDLDFLAVTPGSSPRHPCRGGRPRRQLHRSPLAALGAIAICLAVLWSLARLAARDVGSALRARPRRSGAGISLADRPSLNLLAQTSLHAGAAHEQGGDSVPRSGLRRRRLRPQPGHVVRARSLRGPRARRLLRRLRPPQPRVHARPVRPPVDEGLYSTSRATTSTAATVRETDACGRFLRA